MSKQIGIKLDMAAFKADDTNTTIEDLELLNDALIELAVEYGFYIGGRMELCDEEGNKLADE